MRRFHILGLAVGLSLSCPVAAMAADIYGLVIGVNAYDNGKALKGAVADAKDIKAALEGVGAKEIRMLLDYDASRKNVMAAWADLTRKAKPGDTIVFAFSGHGAQSPERIKGSEKDGKDEFLVLSRFNWSGPASSERIVDDDLGAMIESVPGINVVAVIDSCNSGTMTRSYGDNPTGLTYRTMNSGTITDDALPMPTRASDFGVDRQPNLLYLGAVHDGELAPEVPIRGQRRGMLSYLFSRALEGPGDLDEDGVVSKEELEVVVLEGTKIALDGQQHPVVAPDGRRDISIPLRPAPPPSAVTVAAASTAPVGVIGTVANNTPTVNSADDVSAVALAAKREPLPLAILNPGSSTAAELAAKLSHVTLVEADKASLLWDVARRGLYNATGDVVLAMGDVKKTRAFSRASSSEPAFTDAAGDLPMVQKVVDRAVVVEALKAMARREPLPMSLKPDDKVHSQGQKVAFEVSGFRNSYFTLFNIGADGTVNYLYPVGNDPMQIPPKRPFVLDLEVTAPFGSDHLVAISSDTPLVGLHDRLKAADGKAVTPDLLDAVADRLKGGRSQIGVHAAFSAP